MIGYGLAVTGDLVPLREASFGGTLTGEQVAQALRNDPETARVALIMVSGNSPAHVAGLVDRVVTKPTRR
ncbi:hypothetical protein AB0M36_07410 [Actinoplanes sp. NPDC051346]|uniref:hypothetical protein n=1 Tax=Actinoplanes sp. NPDC051346 TaxID=3155048 RepID=UPI003445F130